MTHLAAMAGHVIALYAEIPCKILQFDTLSHGAQFKLVYLSLMHVLLWFSRPLVKWFNVIANTLDYFCYFKKQELHLLRLPFFSYSGKRKKTH